MLEFKILTEKEFAEFQINNKIEIVKVDTKCSSTFLNAMTGYDEYYYEIHLFFKKEPTNE